MIKLLAAVGVAATLPLASALAQKPLAAPHGPYKMNDATHSKFKLSKSKKVSGISVLPGAGSSSACGTARVRVKGSHKLSIARRGGYASWIIGKNAPRTSSGVKPISVQLVVGGTPMKGKLDMIWRFDNTKLGDGDLTFGDCDLFLDFSKSK